MNKKMKAIVMSAVMLGIAGAGAPAVAAGGTGAADNWSIKLTFSTPSHADLLPITLGQNATSREVMKPPPMPGKSVTLNADDAIVNAFVKGASKKIAESVAAPIADAPGVVWAIEVNAEEPNTEVSLTPDLGSAYSGYSISVIDPESGTRTALSTTGSKVTVFTTDANATAKTLYILASSSKSYAVAGKTAVKGGVGMARMYSGADMSGINVYVDGSLKGTTDASGNFSIDALSAGSHDIKLDADGLISSRGTLVVAADGSAAVALNDPIGGDANNDGIVDMRDYVIFKKCFDKTAPDDRCPADKLKSANFDRSPTGDIDMRDYVTFKTNYEKHEPEIAD